MAKRRIAKRKVARKAPEWKRKKILIGALIFFIGLLRYLEIGWAEILMIVGALVVIKGISVK